MRTLFRHILLVGLVMCGVYSTLFLVYNQRNANAESAAFAKLKLTTLHIAIGTGFVIEAPSGRHYMITNWHVCNAGNYLGKMFGNYDDGRLVQGPVVKSQPQVDLCATLIDRQPTALRMAAHLVPLQTVYTRGYPLGVLSETSGKFIGYDQWKFQFEIEEVGECFPGSNKLYRTNGVLGACSYKERIAVLKLYGRPGSSGSPAVNSDGDIVGVVSSWDSEHDVGGMVPLDKVKTFMKDL